MLALIATPQPAQPVPPGFNVETVASGLSFPVTMVFASDGRLFFTEKPSFSAPATGTVRVIQAGVLNPTPVLTVSVDALSERGMLGVELDPNFNSNGFMYVFYTNPSPISSRVVRYTIVGNTATSPTTLLDIPDDSPASGNHNGGNLHFGPDSKLYVMQGDGGTNSSNSQNLSTLLGKMLRLNSDGSIPSDNPFPSSAVFALGLRNSFDFEFHPLTGKMYSTENGPSDNDEINIIEAGQNYGWPTVRGIAGNPSFVDPIIAFTPTTAPTGIAFCPAGALAPEYQNNLFFGEFNTRKIRRIVLAARDTKIT